MDEQSKLEKSFEVLLWQYRQCLSIYRTRINITWQLPSISMAIISFFAVTYLGYAKTHITRIFVLLGALLFTFVLVMKLRKNRFKINAIHADIKGIQERVCDLAGEHGIEIREIKLLTDDILDDKESYPRKQVPRYLFIRQEVGHLLLGSFIVTMVFITSLLVYEVTMFLISKPTLS